MMSCPMLAGMSLFKSRRVLSYWREATEDLEGNFRSVGDSTLWQLRNNERKSLVDYVRKLHVRQLASLGSSSEERLQAAKVLEASTLTLGFARRFATYKRPNLLLHDPGRLVNILANRDRPVQLVLAGKAHPQDAQGQDMLRGPVRNGHGAL